MGTDKPKAVVKF